MPETLQRLLACDTCGSSDLKLMLGHSDDPEWYRLLFLCKFNHRTEVKVEKAL